MQTQVATTCGVLSRDLTKWLRGRDTHQPAVSEAGAAAKQWHVQNKDRPTRYMYPSNAAGAMRVEGLIARLGTTHKQVATASGVMSGDLTKWLCGIDTHQPAVFEAGAAATLWHAQNKDRPIPSQYNAADAARVGALIMRLGVTHKQVAAACGVSLNTFGKRLCGIDTHQPAVVKAGAAATRWWG